MSKKKDKIIDKQSVPWGKRQGYTKIDSYPERGTY
jgi:hypothetical protein